MAQDERKMSLPRRQISPLAQLISIAVVALFAGIAIFVWPVIGKNTADRAEHAEPGLSAAAPETFRPTKEQWAEFKIEPVRLLSFRPAQVTEGNIAVDDNLTTAVFSHYSGRVTKVIAMLGDVVRPRAPLFVMHANEFVHNKTATGVLFSAASRAGPGAGRTLCRYRGVVPGIGRRLVEPRRCAAGEKVGCQARPMIPAVTIGNRRPAGPNPSSLPRRL